MRKLTTAALQLLMCWLLLVQPSSQASLQGSQTGPKGRPAKNKTEINICDLQQREALVCFCDTIDMYIAKTSNCFVVDVLKVDDPIWKHMVVAQPRLERLEFAVRVGANMSYVPTTTLREFKNLTHITLRDSSMEELPEKAFSDIQSLVEIHAARCGIVHLRKYAFGNMTKLNAILLEENRIYEINR